MSIVMDSESCYTFSEDKEYLKKSGIESGFAYVPYKLNDNIYIFEVKITKVEERHGGSRNENLNSYKYLHFSIIYNEEYTVVKNPFAAIKKSIQNLSIPFFGKEKCSDGETD